MASKIGIRPQARLDVVELATHIGQDSVTAANRFLDACDSTFQLLAEAPGIGGSYPTKNDRLAGLRVFRVKKFPSHLTFYLQRQNGIEIVRVVHGSRDIDAALRDA
jgi:toxin ParE1/3/4